MWVSKKKMDRIEKRLDELESFKRDSVYWRYFDVYDPEVLARQAASQKAMSNAWIMYESAYPLSSACKQEISVKDVLERVLKHIGLELVYVRGNPTKVEVAKTKKA